MLLFMFLFVVYRLPFQSIGRDTLDVYTSITSPSCPGEEIWKQPSLFNIVALTNRLLRSKVLD